MDNDVMNNGTMSQLNDSVYSGGELMPMNSANDINMQPSNLEMAASIVTTMVIGYGIGKLGELAFDKLIGPAAKKLSKKWEDKMAKKKGHNNDSVEDPKIINGSYKVVNSKTKKEKKD